MLNDTTGRGYERGSGYGTNGGHVVVRGYFPGPTAVAIGEAGKPPEFFQELVFVTPELAAYFLTLKHNKQRGPKNGQIAAMAQDLSGDHFELTHESICFANGVLIDGQQRCEAIVMSGVGVRLLITHHPNGRYDAPMNTGTPRTVREILRVPKGYPSVFSVLRALERGSDTKMKMTASAAREYLPRYASLVELVRAVPRGHTLIAATMGACIWALPCNQKKVIEFAEKTATGEMIGRGNPVYAYRGWLERNTASHRWDAVMAALNCISYFLHGEELASVHTGASGYRAFCSRRRALRVPNTPSPEVVLPGS